MSGNGAPCGCAQECDACYQARWWHQDELEATVRQLLASVGDRGAVRAVVNGYPGDVRELAELLAVRLAATRDVLRDMMTPEQRELADERAAVRPVPIRRRWREQG